MSAASSSLRVRAGRRLVAGWCLGLGLAGLAAPPLAARPPQPPNRPLPANVRSRFLETRTGSFALVGRLEEPVAARYLLVLALNPALPRGSVLEARFENPARPGAWIRVPVPPAFLWGAPSPMPAQAFADPGQPAFAGEDVAGQRVLTVVSPVVRSFRCRDYRIEVDVYADASRRHRLAVHPQAIRSSVDTSRVRTMAELMQAVEGASGPCLPPSP